MILRGKIKNGKVVLDDPEALADGTEVEIRLAKKKRAAGKRAKKPKPPESGLATFVGTVKDLPRDMSVNLDHYLYGHPKQK